MRRLAPLALVAVAALPAPATAQRPTVSPALLRVWDRDTTVRVWCFVVRDVPLDAARARLAGAGGTVRRSSRWLHAVSADLPTAALRSLAAGPPCARLQPVARFVGRPEPPPLLPLPAAPPERPTPASLVDSIYGPSSMPFRRLNLRPLDSIGVRGAGVRIAILDAGFDRGNPALVGATVVAQRDFVLNTDTVVDHFHGTAVWGLFAGNVTGQLVGAAREASYLLARTENAVSETRVEEDNYVAALEWADSIGVDVVSSSLGYLKFDDSFSYTPGQLNGDIAVTTMAADLAAARGILVVTAAGNGGPGSATLVTPGDADSVITVGAEDSLGTLAVFSSRGPTADGRLKPELTAPGVAVWTTFARDAYGRLSGTSFATPLTAAAAALVKQLHPTFGPIDIRTALELAGTNRAQPDAARGWGRPDATLAALFPRGVRPVLPVSTPLTTVTPTFDWAADDVPPVAQPVRHRLRVGRDVNLAALYVDTVLPGPPFTLRRALPPGTRVYWRVYLTAAAGTPVSLPTQGPFEIPPWVRLLSFDDPAGVTTADSQPEFLWAAADIASPPGPFTFDLTVRRASTGETVFRATGLTSTTFRMPVRLERNTPFGWSVTARAGGDSVTVRSRGVFLVLDESVPRATLLFQNFPNPFPEPRAGISGTCFWFDLSTAGPLRLDILDLGGRLVRALFSDPNLPPGRYGRQEGVGGSCDPRLSWDGRADDGTPVPPGVYLYRLKAPGGQFVRRLVYRGSRR